MLKHRLKLLTILFSIPVVSFFLSCSDDSAQVDLTGQWEGRNTNDTTGKSWTFHLYLEDYPDSLSGIYSDNLRTVSIRNISYKNNQFGFVIDLYPETVTFFGKLDGNNSMSGTWSYSADLNNGLWYLYRVTTGFEDTTPEPEATPDEGSADPFSKSR